MIPSSKWIVAAGMMVLGAGVARGQDYPIKPVRILTAGVGGSNDVISRLVAQGISPSLGQQVIVDNRPTSQLPNLAAKAAPDGYTVLVFTGGLWLLPFMANVNYDVFRAPYIKSGRLRAIAVTSPQPSAQYPELPTVAAVVPGYESGSLCGMLVPAKTPDAIIKRLNQEAVRYLNTADAKARFLSQGTEAVGSTPEEFAATIKSEMARMGKMIKEVGIREE